MTFKSKSFFKSPTRKYHPVQKTSELNMLKNTDLTDRKSIVLL
jgi:hypothetical protein